MTTTLPQRFEKYGPDIGRLFSDLILLTAPEIAELTGLSPQTCYKLLASGEIKARRMGRSVRASLGDVAQFIDRMAE